MRISKQARRKQILEVTARLIEQKGFNGIVTKDIAGAAKISDTLVFRHFGSLEKLYRTVCETYIRNFANVAMDPRTTQLGNFVHEFAQQYIRTNLEEPRAFRIYTRAVLERPQFIDEIRDSIAQSGPLLEMEYLFKKSGYSGQKAKEFTRFIFDSLTGDLRDYLFFGITKTPPDPEKTADLISTVITRNIT